MKVVKRKIEISLIESEVYMIFTIIDEYNNGLYEDYIRVFCFKESFLKKSKMRFHLSIISRISLKKICLKKELTIIKN